jgi:hypothetical protein
VWPVPRQLKRSLAPALADYGKCYSIIVNLYERLNIVFRILDIILIVILVFVITIVTTSLLVYYLISRLSNRRVKDEVQLIIKEGKSYRYDIAQYDNSEQKSAK